MKCGFLDIKAFVCVFVYHSGSAVHPTVRPDARIHRLCHLHEQLSTLLIQLSRSSN